MRFNRSRSVLLATAIITASAISSGSRADGGKQSPESSSKNAEAITNSASFKPKQNGLRQLEQDLFKPFETIAPKGSLDGAYVPSMPEPQPTAPTVQSKRAKELLERRRDWVFETPEEILAAPSTDDIMNGRNKEKQNDDKPSLSPIERFYERLYNKEKKGATHKGNNRDELSDSSKPGISSDDPEGDDDADLPLGVRETQREMRKLLIPKERKDDSSIEPSNGFSDVFGLSKKAQSREELEMQKERMDRYKVLIGLPVTPSPGADPLKPFRDIVGTSPKSPGLFPTMDSMGTLPQQNLFGGQSGSASVAPNSMLLPDGAKIHTAPSLAPVLPKVEPPKTLPPPVTFSAPRRAF
jgi:hypothetical protein